jgi:hypothetical protein
VSEDLDKIKEKIGLYKLDNDTREKLFKEFQKSGGKVLDERELMRQRLKQKLSTPQPPIQQRKTPEPEKKLSTPKKEPKTQLPRSHSESNISYKPKNEINISPIDRIKVYMNAYFSNIIKLLSGSLKTKFIEETSKTLKDAFLDLRLISFLLTSKDKTITNIVKKNLNPLHSFAFEIIYRLSELYKDDVFSRLERFYKIELQTREGIKPNEIKNELIYIFKKLIMLYPFRNELKVIVYTAIRSISSYLQKDEPQKIHTLFSKSWSFIFEYYFDKIYKVISLIIGKELPLTSEYLLKFLGVSEEDYIGFLTEKKGISQIEEEIKKENRETSATEKEKKEDILDESMNLINSIKIREIQKSIKNKDFEVDENDKVFILEAIMEFFERHIFPVLFSRAKYVVTFDGAKKLDIKNSFEDSYVNLTSIKDKINEYYKIVSDCKTIEADPMVPFERKSNLLNSRNLEKSKLSYEIRKGVTEILGRMKNLLEIVLSDYKTEKKILSNPDEVIEFKKVPLKDIEEEKNIFEGEKTIDALIKIHKFLNGVIFLFTDGDLGGSNTKLEKTIYLKNI